MNFLKKANYSNSELTQSTQLESKAINSENINGPVNKEGTKYSNRSQVSIKDVARRDMPKEFVDFMALFGIFKPRMKAYHEFLNNVDLVGEGFLLASRMEEYIESNEQWNFKLESVRCSLKFCEIRSFDDKSSDIAFRLKLSGNFDEIDSIKGIRNEGTSNLRSRNNSMSVSVFSVNIDM